jgi:hypothetical protein
MYGCQCNQLSEGYRVEECLVNRGLKELELMKRRYHCPDGGLDSHFEGK